MFEDDENFTLNQIEANNQLQQVENSQINGLIPNENTAKRAINTILELSDDELNKIEEHLKTKIIRNSENFFNQYENLRASSEKLKIEFEQHFLELEAEYNECRIKLESESRNSHLNQTKANEFDEKLSILQKQNRILNDEKETLLSNVQRSNSVNNNLESEKRDLHIQLDKYIRENDRLKEEWKSMNTKLSENESSLAVSTARLEEAQSREATITFREKQFQSDKQRLLNEIEWLNTELEKKSTQMLQLRSEYNQKSFEQESKLEDLTAENKKFKSLNENLQLANQSMENQIEELTNKLQDIRDKYAQDKIDFQEESQSREKIIQLYQEENESSKRKLEEAADAIKDLKLMVIELKNEYSKLLDEKTTTETAFESKLKESTEIISKLEQELKNANELLSIAKRKGATVLSEADIEQLSPAAAVASRLLKNGMTLTQIYSEYVNLAENLQNEKIENHRLTSYINEVVKEIEEKAPVLKKQKLEYEEAVKTIDNLTNQLENAMMDYEVLKSKSEDSIKKYNLVSSENIRLRQDCNDLSRQVTILLHEVEKLRSKLLSNQKKSVNLNKSDMIDLNQSNISFNEGTEVTNSSEVISKDILLFRNIDELQKQNQKLVRLLHEVTDKKQSEEKNELEQKTKEYNEKLNLALRELEEFKIQREKHEQVLDEIRKQRDTYKQLLNSQQHQIQRNLQADTPTNFFTSTPGGLQKPKVLSSSENVFLNDDRSKDNHLKELNEKTQLLDKIQKQFETYQTEMINCNKLLNEEIETYRASNSELSMKLALSDSRLESTLERCKSLNTAIEKSRKELDTYKERNSKLNEQIVKHEQSLSSTTQELNRSNEKICEMETKLHSLTFERDMLKSNHERIIKERDLLMLENSSRSTILANLDMIKNSCDRNERETKLIYMQKIEQLERENLIQRKQLEQDQDKHAVIIKSWQNQFEQLQQQDELEKQNHEKTRHLYAEIKQSYDQLKDKCDKLEAKLHSNELIVQMTRNTKSSSAISRLTHLEEETKDLQMKLSLADKETVSLKIQLEESRGHAKQYKSIAETMEKTVKESSEANERTKTILERRIQDLEAQLAKLSADFESLTAAKLNLEFSLENHMQSSAKSIEDLETEKKRLIFELEMIRKKLENTEKISDERNKNRDEYVAKIAILEDQLNNNETKLTQTERDLNEKQEKINDLEKSLEKQMTETELEKRAKLEIQHQYESDEQLLNESLTNVKKENEDLTKQLNLLQQELSKLSKDFIILQKQDPFKTNRSQDLSISEQTSHDQSTPSNLLEINRFLRVQKDQLEEKYENMKLTFEINQQRIKTVDSELDFYRKQSQSYESEIQHLKMSMENFKQTNNLNNDSKSSSENFNLMLDTNKRLKDELDTLNTENSKIKNDVIQLEEQVSNLKSRLNESELRNESIKGENTCMVTELKRWKDRCDALLQGSDHAEEWARIKIEVQKAQEKAQDLTDMINELRNNLTDSNSKVEQLTRELETVKSQSLSEKTKLQQEFDTYRIDKTKREEMFKALVSELREVAMLVQKELELKSVDWSMKGPIPDKIKSIKEEMLQLKQSISEKLKALKEEVRHKPKQLDDMTNELAQMNKKLEECENKIKEKDTRIGQMNNFITQMKTKLSTCQKAKDDAVKELTDLKSSSAHNITQQEASETINKTELDTLRSRFLQSQFENERLKKELASTNTPVIEANLSSKLPTQPTQQQTTITNTQTISPQQKINTTTPQTPVIGTENQQALPPTAYIAPSRITQKSQQQTPQQSQQQQQSNNLRRTAAVQPTPHDSGNATTSSIIALSSSALIQRHHLVNPLFNTENIQVQQQDIQTTEQGSSFLSSQSTSSSTSSFINKRTREEDQNEDNVQPGTSTASNTNNKKQRNSETFPTDLNNQQQSVAAIEPYPSSNQFTDQNEYIVINDEIQPSDINELQDSQEEIIELDNDDEENNNNAGTESQENELDVIITEVNAIRRNENLQQNILSSTSERNQQNIQLDDYENVVEEEEDANNDLNEQDEMENEDENDQDDVVENDDESNQRNQEDDAGDDDSRSNELRLDDDNDHENADSNLRENSESNEDNQNENHEQEENSDSQADYDENNQNNAASPDSSAPQSSHDQQQQQQSIQSSVVSSESNNQVNSSISSIQLKTATISTIGTGLFGQQQPSMTQTKNIVMPSTSTFGSNNNPNPTEQRREAPKPIVWDTSSNQPSQLFQSANTSTAITTTTAPGNNFRIRRTPVAQTTNLFQTQPTAASNSQQTNQPNYFQTDNAVQQHRVQNNPFQSQQNQFGQANQTQTGLINAGQQQLINQRTLIRNQRVQQPQTGLQQPQQAQQQQQPQHQQQTQPIRLMGRGGIVGNQIRRGGGNGTSPAGSGINPAQRGGRANF